MRTAKFAIGIDLGTTNCALAFRPLMAGASTVSQVLPLPQWSAPGQVLENPTLPSFLYRPLEGEAAAFRERPGTIDHWVVGLAAREQVARTPGRVVHSAKSWLAHHGSDPEHRFLPWKSEALTKPERISPLEASAALLSALRRAWENAFPEAPLAEQEVVVTVPASFDLASQQATLAAAIRAGLPGHTRLLEEPQAAFYRWLEATGPKDSRLRPGEHVLVVDVGGGTSDFSFFRVGEDALERIAVSEHLLLGGDNVDLALAHFLEAQLVDEGEEMRGDAWSYLVARAREVKERALAESAPEIFRVAAPGRGSSLVASAASAEIPAEVIRELVLDGFYPACARYERPSEERSALQEWGLPYAADFAVTRYLAAFLRDLPPVDHVLFNGGSLQVPLLRERLVALLGRWQNGKQPSVLENPETDLAVARGAAFYGALSAEVPVVKETADAPPERTPRIQAGLARGLFLELGSTASRDRRLVCALPQGASPGDVFTVEVEGLRALLNREVVFRAFQGAHHRTEAAGEVVVWNASDFAELPWLETRLETDAGEVEAVAVELGTSLNEVGAVRLEIVAAEAPSGSWSLAFNLRRQGELPPPSTVSRAVGQPVDVAPVKRLIARAFGGSESGRERLSAARILERAESLIGLPRFQWPIQLLRELSDTVLALPEEALEFDDRREIWLQLVGWLMRPGFGDGQDPARIERLTNRAGPSRFPFKKRFEPTYALMWRRLAGGLPPELQHALWDSRRAWWLNPAKASPEAVRLAGALEQLDRSPRLELTAAFLSEAEERLRRDAHAGPYLAALAGLLGRFGISREAVILPPEEVEQGWERLGALGAKTERWRKDWANLFLRSARVVEDDSLNLAPRQRRKIADRLEKAGVSPQRTAPLREFIPLAEADTATLHEDALPPGLLLE